MTWSAKIPRRMLRWRFYGDGLESLRLEEADVPSIGTDQLLVRQDACGLCFSDTKVIALGASHPRMAGRDLRQDPVTLGHEVSCTVVKVGESLRDRFRPGDRFIVQADVFHQGVSMAYGYAIPGGLSEYSIIPRAMIEGDEGCYLIPIQRESGLVETALVEPWACVVAAYRLEHRAGLKPGGALLVLAGEGADSAGWSGLLRPGAGPRRVVAAGAGDSLLRDLARGLAAGALLAAPLDSDWKALSEKQTGGAGFDDILALGALPGRVVEAAASTLADHGILAFAGGFHYPDRLSLDVGRIHYNQHWYLGTPARSIADAYAERRGAEIQPGGNAWLIGAGGPMGQMHVQRAVQLPGTPARILATDVDAGRLQSVLERFGPTARARGIVLETLNPKELTPEAYDQALRRFTHERGFDDIICLVPSPALIEHSAGFLAAGGWLNIFAGVARGTMARLDVNDIISRRVRIVGSSGSSIADMRATLEKVETGELSTNMSLAAIGGMRAAREGIAAVRDGRFAGKTLIFPGLHDLPLTPLSELENHFPTVAAKLQNGRFWTREAEAELFRALIGRSGPG